MLIFHGKRKALTGSVEAFMYECPHCNKINTTTLFVYSWYYHIFWIPLFPFAREGAALCSDCGSRRDESRFGPKLVQEFKSNRYRLRHPWWTWAWPIMFLLLIVSIIVIAGV